MMEPPRTIPPGKEVSPVQESRFYRFIRPLIPPPLRPLALKYQAVLSYLFFGVLTTLVNFLLYFPLSRVMHYLAANVLAWIGAVVFAYLTNRSFVFEDHRRGTAHFLRQGAAFAGVRLFSLGAEEVLLFLLIECLGVNADLTKVIAAVVVTVLNYFFSKYLVFRNRT